MGVGDLPVPMPQLLRGRHLVAAAGRSYAKISVVVSATSGKA